MDLYGDCYYTLTNESVSNGCPPCEYRGTYFTVHNNFGQAVHTLLRNDQLLSGFRT